MYIRIMDIKANMCFNMEVERIYDKPLSKAIQTLMWQVMKQASRVEQGFLYFRNRTIMKVYFDQEECDKVLLALVINKKNVLTYLKRKYIPTKIKDGLMFKDQKCIQKAVIKEDGTLYIHIKNSEPHKIITDTIHVMGLLRAEGFEFREEVKFYIEQVKIAFQDVMLYNLCLEEFGFKVPSSARIFDRQLRKKYARLETIAGIKMRSVKRKFARWLVKEGKIEWEDLRNLLKIDDFAPSNIKHVCKEIRDRNKERGIQITY